MYKSKEFEVFLICCVWLETSCFYPFIFNCVLPLLYVKLSIYLYCCRGVCREMFGPDLICTTVTRILPTFLHFSTFRQNWCIDEHVFPPLLMDQVLSTYQAASVHRQGPGGRPWSRAQTQSSASASSWLPWYPDQLKGWLNVTRYKAFLTYFTLIVYLCLGHANLNT